jgi:hypothetical protein
MKVQERRTRIAQRAYELWEIEGRPVGRDLEHWLRAEAEIATNGRKPRARRSNTAVERARRTSKVATVEKGRGSSRRK